MTITINGKQYEVNSEKELLALMERFDFNSKRFQVLKRYNYSNMTHVHSTEINETLARSVARAVSLQADVEVTWIEAI